MNRLNLAVIIIIAFVLVYVFFLRTPGKDKLMLKVTHAQVGTIEKNIIVPGIVKPSKEIDIKSNISGVIEHVYARVGDEIKEGDPLVRIKIIGDPVEYEKLVKKSEASTAQYEHNKRLYETNKLLYEEKVISKSELDVAETNYKLSEAEFGSNKKELEMLSGNSASGSSSNIIRATSDGTILELPVKLGGSVIARSNYSEGTTVAKLANLRSLTFFGSVPERDVSLLNVGDTIYLSFSAINKIIPATLSLISPKGTQTDGVTFFDIYANVIADENPKTFIRAGYTANAKITVNKVKNVISLDESYIQFSHDTTYVEIVDSFEIIKKQTILTGLSDGINTEILSGITILDKIKLPNTQEEEK